MKPVLILRHVPHESAGTLDDHLAQAGLPIQYVDLFERIPASLPLHEAAGLVVMGGPMNVDEVERYPFLAAEVTWIRQALAQALPTIGICLGSQLLAKALGAPVYPNGIKEIGWYRLRMLPGAADDCLFAGSAPTETVFQWHGDTFDLPAGAVHLAESPQCRHQAFRHGRNAWGLQFHVEITRQMIADWLAEPGNCGELAQLDYIHPQQILADAPREAPAMERVGQRILSRFAALCAGYATATGTATGS
jgi:GMP synthase (glutamine-hydrolysing)